MLPVQPKPVIPHFSVSYTSAVQRPTVFQKWNFFFIYAPFLKDLGRQ